MLNRCPLHGLAWDSSIASNIMMLSVQSRCNTLPSQRQYPVTSEQSGKENSLFNAGGYGGSARR